jgi:hypothetical protein
MIAVGVCTSTGGHKDGQVATTFVARRAADSGRGTDGEQHRDRGTDAIPVHGRQQVRAGVLAPDIDDPALNPLYRDVLAHYGSVALPCRIQDPDQVTDEFLRTTSPVLGRRRQSFWIARDLRRHRIPDILLDIGGSVT